MRGHEEGGHNLFLSYRRGREGGREGGKEREGGREGKGGEEGCRAEGFE